MRVARVQGETPAGRVSRVSRAIGVLRPFAALAVLMAAGLWVAVFAQSVTARGETNTVAAGQSAAILVTAPAGTTVTLTATGAAPLPPPVTVVGNGREMRVTIGPFAQAGDYVIAVTGGGQAARVNMRVSFPAAEPPAGPAGNAGEAYRQAASSLLDSMNGIRTGLSRLPQGNPTVEETKREMDELQRQLEGIRARANETAAALDEYGQLLGQEGNASREGRDEFARLQHEITQVLNEDSRQMRELARDAGQTPDDPCVAAMAVTAALRGQSAVAASMQNGARDFGVRQHVTPGGDGADWARTTVNAGRPLRGEGTSQSSAAQWRAIKPKIDGLVASGAAANYTEAQRLISQASGDSGLGRFGEQQCLMFKGDWSGTTLVEALEKGQAFYGLQNDWTAHVELAAARSSGTSADAPVRGTLTGRGTAFKVINQLRTLYAGRPADMIEYLTSDPTPAQQASANFVASIEGTIRNNQMTLKIRPGGVDYAGRVTGKIAAVVIPKASPVPLVQTYDVSFQGGLWQLMRALGPNGVTERPLPITVGGGKRLVQADFPRNLSATGARGAFTIKIRLCAGCD